MSCLTVFETGSLYVALDGLEITSRMQARKQLRGSLTAQITAGGTEWIEKSWIHSEEQQRLACELEMG